MRISIFLLLLVPPLAFGCSYDYASLGGAANGGRGGTAQTNTGGAGNGSGGGTAVIPPGSGGRPPGGSGGLSGSGGLGGSGGSGGRGGSGGNASGGSASGGGPPTTGTGGAMGGAGGGRGGVGGGPAAQRILSIDFVGDYLMMGTAGAPGGAGGGAGAAVVPLTPLPAMGPAEIAGVKPASRWNAARGMMGSLGALTLAGGDATAATVTWNSPPSSNGRGTWWRGFVDMPGDVRMMNGYLDPHSADMPELPATITVGALPAAMVANGYDVYVYFSGDVPGAARTYRYSIGMTTLTATQAGPSPTTFSGYALAPPGGMGNYIVFRNVTGPGFTLLATPGAGARAPVNGIQIVSPTGS